MRDRYLRPSDRPARFVLTERVRSLVEIRRLNLVDPEWPDEGPFDVIFCRNVLMYLEAGYRESVARRMASRLVPGGLLILDPAEHLGRVGPLFSHRGAGVFTLRPTARIPIESDGSAERLSNGKKP